jgi:hypothetical protein
MDQPVLIQAGSVQCSTPSPLTRGEMFLPFIWPPNLSRMGAICSPAVGNVVTSTADDVSCSPGRVAVSLSGIEAAPGRYRQAAV